MNAYAERFVRSVQEERLSKLIPIGPRMLQRSRRSETDRFWRRTLACDSKDSNEWVFMIGFLEMHLGGIARIPGITARAAAGDRRPARAAGAPPHWSLTASTCLVRYRIKKSFPSISSESLAASNSGYLNACN